MRCKRAASYWYALGVFLSAIGSALAQAPEVTPGCVYNTTLPTLATGQRVAWQCDSSGRLVVSGAALLGGASGDVQFNTGAGTFGGLTNAQLTARIVYVPMTRQILTSGTLYTRPTSPTPLYLKIKLIGGGGGGGGSGTTTTGGAGGNGGATNFNTSIIGNGGNGAASAGAQTFPTGGTASGGYWNLTGGAGGAPGTTSANPANGGAGCSSQFGAGGMGGIPGGGAPGAAVANTGAGGGGGGGATTVITPAGGACGGYSEAHISTPAATYPYAIGAAGTLGTAGTSGVAGTAGAAGVIWVEEYYQ